MNKNLLFSCPILVISLTMILLGTLWLIVDEPWMLDKAANVERLGMTFDELFEPTINDSLPGYLRQIYRFFGYWVVIIGLFISLFATPSITNNKKNRQRLLFCMFVMMFIGTILGYSLIPSSHFIYLIWIMNLLYAVSLYSHLRIINES